MNQNNFDIIELDNNYSTTRRLMKADPEENPEAFAVIENAIKQSSKPEDKFETVLSLPEGENRQGEGGLRTKGYFKVGGLIPNQNNVTSNSSQEEKPLITVVTVVYNAEQFLEETIRSVINQTYDNVEYIIIDGGSTDGTLDIIKKYEHAIDYWVSEKDKGIYDAMNKGIDLATGEWINFMNGGDTFYCPTTLISVFSIGDIHHYYLLYGDVNSLYNGFSKVHKAKNIEKINIGMVFSHQSAFFKSSIHKKFPYETKLKLAADFYTILQIYYLNKNKFKYFGQVVSSVETDGVSQKYILLTVVEYLKVIRLLKKGNLKLYFSYILKILVQCVKFFLPNAFLNVYRKIKYGL